jgi:hypothetical protein
MCDILTINTYINGLTLENLDQSEKMMTNVIGFILKDHVKYLKKSTNAIDIQLYDSLRLMAVAVLTSRLDILEYVLFNKRIDGKIIKIAFTLACCYNMISVIKYLDLFTIASYDNVLYVALEAKMENDFAIEFLIDHTNLTDRSAQHVVRTASFLIAKSIVDLQQHAIRLADVVWAGNINLVKHYETLNYVISPKDLSDAIFPCARGGLVRIAKYLVKKYNLNLRSNAKAYARTAACNGQIKFIKYLMDSGFDVITNNSLILQFGVQSESIRMVKFLVRNGVALDGINKNILNYVCTKGMRSKAPPNTNYGSIVKFFAKNADIQEIFRVMKSTKQYTLNRERSNICMKILHVHLFSLINEHTDIKLRKQITNFAKKNGYVGLLKRLAQY